MNFAKGDWVRNRDWLPHVSSVQVVNPVSGIGQMRVRGRNMIEYDTATAEMILADTVHPWVHDDELEVLGLFYANHPEHFARKIRDVFPCLLEELRTRRQGNS